MIHSKHTSAGKYRDEEKYFLHVAAVDMLHGLMSFAAKHSSCAFLSAPLSISFPFLPSSDSHFIQFYSGCYCSVTVRCLAYLKRETRICSCKLCTPQYIFNFNQLQLCSINKCSIFQLANRESWTTYKQSAWSERKSCENDRKTFDLKIKYHLWVKKARSSDQVNEEAEKRSSEKYTTAGSI